MTGIQLKAGQHWKHKKSGGHYEIVELDCSIQAPSETGSDWMEDESWVAYRNIKGGTLIFRMTEEFLDGRFELIKESE